MNYQNIAQHDLHNSSALSALPPMSMRPDKNEQALSIALQTIAEQQRRIIELEKEAQTDPLTGLMNKRAFKTAMERELNRAARTNKPSAMLVMFDLDNMKSVNDTYGHMVGDVYLAGVAGVLRKLVRGTDYIARLGGDEFALLLTDVNPTQCWKRVKDIAHHLNGSQIKCNSIKLEILASHGCALVEPGLEVDLINSEADSRLYACKAERKVNRSKEYNDLSLLMIHD